MAALERQGRGHRVDQLTGNSPLPGRLSSELGDTWRDSRGGGGGARVAPRRGGGSSGQRCNIPGIIEMLGSFFFISGHSH